MFDVPDGETIAMADGRGLRLMHHTHDSADRLGRTEVFWSLPAFTHEGVFGGSCRAANRR
jgi:hypothetical protein